VDLAGISIYTHLIPKVAGEQIKNIMNPLDKNGNVNIKVINAVEEQMKNAQSPQERQATLTAGLSTIEQMYKGKTISLATMTKAAKLLDLSIENIKSLV